MKSTMLFAILSIGLSLQIYSQPNASISPKKVVNNYLDAIGGKSNWSKLQSRKSIETYSVYNSHSLVETLDKTFEFKKIYKYPDNYLSFWDDAFFWNQIIKTSSCTWIYTDQSMNITFMGETYKKKKTNLPQFGILEILNFPMIDSLIVEDDFYRIDFKDEKWKRIMSVFFDPQTFLVRKHSYSNNGTDFHEYYYSDYRAQDGFIEAYLIENFVDLKKFKVISVSEILYNVDIDSQIFIPPVECMQETKVVNLHDALPYPTF